MASKFGSWVKDWEKRQRERFSHNIVDPVERKKSLHFTDWHDHGILRYRWHNFSEVAPGFYRSNQPNHERFESYAALGIKNILNLRGANGQAPYNFEAESCNKLGLNLIDLPLSARMRPHREQLIEVMDTLEMLDGPTLVHCKSGADRTGLVSAIYLIHVSGAPAEEAQKMLSLRFVHLNFTKTGILDHVMNEYAERTKSSPISFRDWVMKEYDPEHAKETFENMGFWQRIKL